MALMPILAGCGHRGAPLPPVYPNPPPITGLIVAQRGSLGIMKFALPELSETIGGQDVELESIQVLVYAERYPVLNVTMIIDGLKRHREIMIQDAKAEAAAAGVRSYLAMVEMILGFDAGVSLPPSDDPEAPVATARRRTQLIRATLTARATTTARTCTYTMTANLRTHVECRATTTTTTTTLTMM